MSEKTFFEAIAASGHVWVAMQKGEVASFKDEDGKIGLLVWDCKENTENFLSNIGAVNSLRPVEIPIEVFKVSWLGSSSMNLNELIINPTGSSQENLVLTKEEIIDRFLC